MSIRERSSSPRARVPDPRTDGDRHRVVTAGRVGNMDARLGTSGFDVVAAAETEDALIDAVSGDEPDAIVVVSGASRTRSSSRPISAPRARSRSGTRCCTHRRRRPHACRRARSRGARCVGNGDGRTPARPRHRTSGAPSCGGSCLVPGGGAASSPRRGSLAAVGEGGSRLRPPCERASRPCASRDRGGHRRVDRVGKSPGDVERTAHARTWSASPCPRRPRSARRGIRSSLGPRRHECSPTVP